MSLTDQHNAECMRVAMGLWPKVFAGLTDEQVAAWHRAWANIPTPTAVRLLRAVFDTNAGYPRPSHLREAMQAGKATGGAPERAKGKSVEETHREIAAAALPALRDAIHAMHAEEVMALYRYWCWQRAIEVYGDGAPSVVAAYWQWQAARYHAGMGDKPADTSATAYMNAMGGKLVERDQHRPRVSWSRIVEQYLNQPATA